MITSHCLTCRHWQAPKVAGRGRAQRPGRCGLDNRLSHPGYTCERFAIRPGMLVKILGVTEEELRWLQAHPADPVTRQLRARLDDIQAASASEAAEAAFLAVLEAWRANHPGV
jgi:hypothetical protein